MRDVPGGQSPSPPTSARQRIVLQAAEAAVDWPATCNRGNPLKADPAQILKNFYFLTTACLYTTLVLAFRIALLVEFVLRRRAVRRYIVYGAVFGAFIIVLGAADGAAPPPDAKPDDLARVRASIRYYMTGEYSPEIPVDPRALTTLETIRDKMKTEIGPGQTDTLEVWGEVCQFYEYLFAQDEGTTLASHRVVSHLEDIMDRAEQSAVAASLDVERRLQRAVRDWFIRKVERMAGPSDYAAFVGMREWVSAAGDVRLPLEKRRKILLFLLKSSNGLVQEAGNYREGVRRILYRHMNLAPWPDWRFLLQALQSEADADPAFALETAKALSEADAITGSGRVCSPDYMSLFLASGQTGPAYDFFGRLLRLNGLTEAERAAIEKLRNNLKKVPVFDEWIDPDLPKCKLADGDAAVRKWIIPRLEKDKDVLLANASVLGQRLLEDCLRELKAPAPKEPLIDIYTRYLYKAWNAGYYWPPVPEAFDDYWPPRQDPGG